MRSFVAPATCAREISWCSQVVERLLCGKFALLLNAQGRTGHVLDTKWPTHPARGVCGARAHAWRVGAAREAVVLAWSSRRTTARVKGSGRAALKLPGRWFDARFDRANVSERQTRGECHMSIRPGESCIYIPPAGCPRRGPAPRISIFSNLVKIDPTATSPTPSRPTLSAKVFPFMQNSFLQKPLSVCRAWLVQLYVFFRSKISCCDRRRSLVVYHPMSGAALPRSSGGLVAVSPGEYGFSAYMHVCVHLSLCPTRLVSYVVDPRAIWRGQSVQLAEKSPNAPQKRTNHPPSSTTTAVQLCPESTLGGLGDPRTGSSRGLRAMSARHTHPGDTVAGWVGRW